MPSLLTSEVSGLPVATSITLPAISSPTATWISLSPYMSSVKLLPEASATVPSCALMVPALRTPGATSAAKPWLEAVMLPRLTIEASRRPGMLKFIRPAMKSALRMSLVRRQEARGVDHRVAAEQHAVAVDDEDAAVGGEGAVDHRRARCPPVTRLSVIEDEFG